MKAMSFAKCQHLLILGSGYTLVCCIILGSPLDILNHRKIKIKKCARVHGVLCLCPQKSSDAEREGAATHRQRGALENVDFNPSSLQVSAQFKIIESAHEILFMHGSRFSLQMNPYQQRMGWKQAPSSELPSIWCGHVNTSVGLLF